VLTSFTVWLLGPFTIRAIALLTPPASSSKFAPEGLAEIRFDCYYSDSQPMSFVNKLEQTLGEMYQIFATLVSP